MGYFKVYFYKKGKSFNNLVSYVSFDSYLCHFISSHARIAMHFVRDELSRISLPLIDDPSKQGDVEILT